MKLATRAPLFTLLVAACGTSSTTSTPSGDAGSGAGDARSRLDARASGGRDAGRETGVGGDAAHVRDGPPSDAPPAADASSVYGPYGADGPASVTTASLTVTPTSGQPFTVVAYIPSTSGTHPVVVLSSGFFQTALAYAPYGERLASWGVVSILRDNPGLSEAAASIASDVSYTVVTWLGAQNADASSPLAGKVDVTRVGLAGHSEGGQVALLAAEAGANGKVKGVFGLDPVDTSTDGAVGARASIASIGVPIAFIGETTDGTGGVAGMPCAPAADNYEVLYGDAASPAVAITAVNADHTMFEDPSHCTFCTLCAAGTADGATVLAFSVRYMTAFFARELLGDASVGAAFQGAGAGADVSAGWITLTSK